jgi:hypothetical protein
MKAYSAKDLWAYEDMLYTLQSALNTAKVYEVFTKDEVITMLTEIQTEISEHWDNDPSYIEGVYDSEMVIQNKINALNKENK